MNQGDLLRYVAEALEALGIEYVIGGSQASTYYGEPRFTQKVSGREIDPRYVTEWATRLGLAEIWAAIVTRAAEGGARAP